MAISVKKSPENSTDTVDTILVPAISDVYTFLEAKGIILVTIDKTERGKKGGREVNGDKKEMDILMETRMELGTDHTSTNGRSL